MKRLFKIENGWGTENPMAGCQTANLMVRGSTPPPASFLPAPADLAAKLLTLLDTVRLGMWVLYAFSCCNFCNICPDQRNWRQDFESSLESSTLSWGISLLDFIKKYLLHYNIIIWCEVFNEDL